MKNSLFLLFFTIYFYSCGREIEIPSDTPTETETIEVTSLRDTASYVPLPIAPTIREKKWYFEFIKDKSTQIRPTKVVFEMNDSVAIFKKVGEESNVFNTFYIRSGGVSVHSTKESIIHKIDLLFFPGLHSALPEHHGIRVIPIVITFSSDYDPISLRVQGCTYYTEIQGNKAEEYTEYHPEVRSKRRKVDVTPLPPTNDQHLVKNGDTLHSIARRYNLTITELIQRNQGLTAESTLLIGEKLKIK